LVNGITSLDLFQNTGIPTCKLSGLVKTFFDRAKKLYSAIVDMRVYLKIIIDFFRASRVFGRAGLGRENAGKDGKITATTT
jgi:hypothetical protein